MWSIDRTRIVTPVLMARADWRTIGGTGGKQATLIPPASKYAREGRS
jgi:hypothetical protein